MDFLMKQNLNKLIKEKNEKCISLYIPTKKSSTGNRENFIRYKNALKQVKEKLKKKNVKSGQMKQILEPAERLLEDDFFWEY